MSHGTRNALQCCNGLCRLAVPRLSSYLLVNSTLFTTISCVMRPVAIWMQYLQPSTAATFSCYICNFKLQTLQLHKLLIQKLLAALFAPISCNLEEEKTITSLGLEPMTFHTKPSCSTEWAIWNDENKCGKWCTNAKFPLNMQLLGAASNISNICI